MEYQQYLNMKCCVVPVDKVFTLEQEGKITLTSAALEIGILQRNTTDV